MSLNLRLAASREVLAMRRNRMNPNIGREIPREVLGMRMILMNIVLRVGSLRRRILRSRVKQLDIEKIGKFVVLDGNDNLFRGLLLATQTSFISSGQFVRQHKR